MKRSSITAILVLAASLATAGLASRKFMSSGYKLAMLPIGLSDERSVIRCAAIVATRLSSMTVASGGICTYIVGHAFKRARTPKIAAALARSLECKSNQHEVTV